MALQGEQTEVLIIKASTELPAPVRTALLQHWFQDLTRREIALRLGVSERTVDSRAPRIDSRQEYEIPKFANSAGAIRPGKH